MQNPGMHYILTKPFIFYMHIEIPRMFIRKKGKEFDVIRELSGKQEGLYVARVYRVIIHIFLSLGNDVFATVHSNLGKYK